jgi:peptide/nickel transport system permease protein
MSFQATQDRPVNEFVWTWEPPRQMMVRGTLSGELLLETPSRTYRLHSVAGAAREFSLDARDISFKRSLGIPLTGSAPDILFQNSTGADSYALVLSSDQQGDWAELSLIGGRFGVMGTDHRGRSVEALFMAGLHVSLLVGLSATFAATLFGVVIGLISGYVGGVLDEILMRFVDVLLSIPTLPILLVLMGIWGKGLWQLVLILSLFSWMGTARLIRSHTMTLRDVSFVEGLRGLGATRAYILRHHILPEMLPLLLSNIVLGVPSAILAEAGVAFLGLSDPQLISWGRMLHEAHAFGAFTARAWWVLVPPGLGIAALSLSFMDLGKFLEERSDPRLHTLETGKGGN